jgi:aldose 1-epimerase
MNYYRKPVAIDPKRFERNLCGHATYLYHLSNARGMEMLVTNYGGKIVQLLVPDRDGRPVDVVLGHDSLDDYLATEEQYFGSLIGRYGNRIAGGHFSLAGESYDLAINNGPNSLHGGPTGFNFRVWDCEQTDDATLVLRYRSADGEEGFPGNLDVEVTYHLSEKNALEIDYHATTDRATVVNLTNHSYFNLSGEGDPSVHDHLLRLEGSTYLPTDDTSIPLSGPVSVEGTPFDFRDVHTVGERIDTAGNHQLELARGYDHTWVLDKELGSFGPCALCLSPKSGIVMEVETDQPGVQIYTANWLTGNMRGKGDSRYPARSAICFETQHYPDSPNHPDYPMVVLRPGETFRSRTTFTFSTADITEVDD